MPVSAVLLAVTTLLLWSFLATLGAHLSQVPPLLLVGVSLCISGGLGAVRLRSWRVAWRTLVVGVAGIFGYHFLFFAALQSAPAVEANLINYLWPLLIVLLSPLFLPHFKLRPHHLAGALAGLLGAGLIVTGGKLSLNPLYLKGYLLAGGAALAWSSYSLMTKRLPPFSTSAVGGFCLTSGLLALGSFSLTANPWQALMRLTLSEWIFLFLLGIGPMGLAFYTWDAALKRGDPRVIGSLAYLTPLSSTLILVLLGGGSLTWVSAIAMALIVLGAVIGSLDLFRKALPHFQIRHRLGALCGSRKTI